MKFSLDWLSDFAAFSDVDPGEIVDAANEIGLEIGMVEKDLPIGNQMDTILDADITPNRPDAMNHRGFARDLAAALGVPFDQARMAETAGSGEPVDRRASVTIEVPDRCHRFAVRMIRGISPARSSDRWLRRMNALSMKSIDAAVDATNISLWGLGQPLHAFDADKVTGGRFVIRLAREGERLLCLDGVERELHPDDVVVADEKRALSIAGVIGGADSAIAPGVTKNVLLEGAWWDPISIRRTSRRHGLHTDASHRYERGADIAAIPEGLSLAAKIVLESAGGELSSGAIDAYPRPFAPRKVALRFARLVALSGVVDLTIERAADILERLGFRVKVSSDRIETAVPSWRPDVSIEEDLIEEVLRIHGYSKIPFALPAADRLSPLYLSDVEETVAPREVDDRIAEEARDAGLFEAMNFPFAPETDSGGFGNLLRKPGFRSTPLTVANPLDATRPVLRRLILPGLLGSASLNHRSGQRSIGLFEVGRVWDRSAPEGADPSEVESRHVAIILAGCVSEEYPLRPIDILDGKGVVRRMMMALTGAEPDFVPAEDSSLATRSAFDVAIRGARIGVLGQVPESIGPFLSLPPSVVVAEIDLGMLPRESREIRYQDYSRFPAADVDITIPCGFAVSWRDVERAVREARLHELEEAVLLKLYVDPLRPEIRNITVRLTFRSFDRTLSQDEVNGERDRLFEVLKQKFGVKT